MITAIVGIIPVCRTDSIEGSWCLLGDTSVPCSKWSPPQCKPQPKLDYYSDILVLLLLIHLNYHLIDIRNLIKKDNILRSDLCNAFDKSLGWSDVMVPHALK